MAESHTVAITGAADTTGRRSRVELTRSGADVPPGDCFAVDDLAAIESVPGTNLDTTDRVVFTSALRLAAAREAERTVDGTVRREVAG